jgi:phosphohistidine phosphatase SixA
VDVTEQPAPAAVPIYLVRHAKAKNRLGWTEPDDLRPLTKMGFRQAEALVALFVEQSFSRL